jgi:hypothetical protein
MIELPGPHRLLQRRPMEAKARRPYFAGAA